MASNPKIKFDYESADTVFTDIVEVNVVNDTVSIGLAVRNIDGNNAKVSHRIYMTLTHFFQFAKVCENVSLDIQKQIKDQINKNK